MTDNQSRERQQPHEAEARQAGMELARRLSGDMMPGFSGELAKAFDHPFFTDEGGEGQVQHIREVERRVTQHINGDVTMTEVQRDVALFSFGKNLFKRKG